MIRTKCAFTGVSLLLCNALLGAGCLLTTGSDDDDGDDNSETGTASDPSSSFTNATTVSDATTVADTTGDDTVGETTGTPTGECTDNVILDGGFEGGTPSAAWTEMSVNFGTPICDTDCTEDPGADPYAGDWYVWFGGIDTDPEIASVSQDVVIDPQTAFLSFRFQINASAGTGNDFFEVTVDDASVFLATDAEMSDYDGYTPISIDISDFADGASHTITFTGDVLGDGLTNFFLDEVALVACVVDDDTTGTSAGSSDGGTSETTATDGSSESGSGSESSSTDASSGSESGTSGSTGA